MLTRAGGECDGEVGEPGLDPIWRDVRFYSEEDGMAGLVG